MKKSLIVVSIILLFFSISNATNAQMMGSTRNAEFDWNSVVSHTRQGEQKGKEIWDKLQSKQTHCTNLNDTDFGALGEYFMGTMTGDAHAAMNAMMMQMHGEQGEEQIHIVMGKRLSGCDTSAAFPSQSVGWAPMMQMMWGDSAAGQTGMMQWGFPLAGFGIVFILLWALYWVLIITAAVLLVRWIIRRLQKPKKEEKTLER